MMRNLGVGRLDAHRCGDLRPVADHLRVVGERRLRKAGRPGRQLQDRRARVAARRGVRRVARVATRRARRRCLGRPNRALSAAIATGRSSAAAANRSASSRISATVVPGSTGMIATSIARHARKKRDARRMIAGSRDDELTGLEACDSRQTLGIAKVSAPDIRRRQATVGARHMNQEARRIVAAEVREAREDFAHAAARTEE